MKQLFGLLVLVAAVAFSTTAFRTSEVVTYNVDLEQSKVLWKAYKVTGQHDGFVNIKSGGLEYTDGLLSGGNFVIDMTSIDCTDLEGKWKDKLVGHLKSEDFFSVEKYPTSTFTITTVTPQGPGKYKVAGDLSIKDITKSIRFTVDIEEGEDSITATTDIELDRSDYNVRYGSSTFFDNLGDKTIYDNFDMGITLVAKK